ncbi:MAG: sulfatase/phosphatase domain-containing protein [Bacteroidota bacterium]
MAALRTDRYKYIETYSETNTTEIVFRELYDLEIDPYELSNLINDSAYDQLAQQLQNTLQQEKQNY